MKLLNLLSSAALAAVGFAAAILPKDVSGLFDRGETSVRLCPAKCNIIVSDCINKDLLGLDTCQQIKCQDRDCAACDAKCKKASPSSIVMASEAERRDTVTKEQEAAPDNTSKEDIELADSTKLFMSPYCPKYLVGNRQACKEKGKSEAECNRQGCNGMCLKTCQWCESFRAPRPPTFIET
ncbi:uncharacterized protein CC84DRAFT_1263043 [Paraphaeosphaeria sporulosa]|uniref:ShKT domain-containing protein n=1 Tax=Paraphaeosphaeria sporulosa TaxID=1460663 RepID=A0A177C2L3_9PLEO|nr:uncharacterized protein CC84DRAFT_1263043 [Paraphaeosphaeria sporulosa]OAG00977.1 hypothetical protein CC84DRAFT_1263043 [Paraphaeosphaeria sporulosa]